MFHSSEEPLYWENDDGVLKKFPLLKIWPNKQTSGFLRGFWSARELFSYKETVCIDRFELNVYVCVRKRERGGREWYRMNKKKRRAKVSGRKGEIVVRYDRVEVLFDILINPHQKYGSACALILQVLWVTCNSPAHVYVCRLLTCICIPVCIVISYASMLHYLYAIRCRIQEGVLIKGVVGKSFRRVKKREINLRGCLNKLWRF